MQHPENASAAIRMDLPARAASAAEQLTVDAGAGQDVSEWQLPALPGLQSYISDSGSDSGDSGRADAVAVASAHPMAFRSSGDAAFCDANERVQAATSSGPWHTGSAHGGSGCDIDDTAAGGQHAADGQQQNGGPQQSEGAADETAAGERPAADGQQRDGGTQQSLLPAANEPPAPHASRQPGPQPRENAAAASQPAALAANTAAEVPGEQAATPAVRMSERGGAPHQQVDAPAATTADDEQHQAPAAEAAAGQTYSEQAGPAGNGAATELAETSLLRRACAANELAERSEAALAAPGPQYAATAAATTEAAATATGMAPEADAAPEAAAMPDSDATAVQPPDHEDSDADDTASGESDGGPTEQVRSLFVCAQLVGNSKCLAQSSELRVILLWVS